MEVTFDVHRERAERSGIFIHVSECATGKIFMMGRAEDKDSFNVVRFCDVLVAPCCSGPTVVIASMWADDCLDLFGCYILFGSGQVLGEFCIELVS